MSNSQSPHHSSRKGRSNKVPTDDSDSNLDQTNTVDEVLMTMVSKFQEHYVQTNSVEESDYVSSEELYTAFQEFYRADYSIDDFVAILSQEFNFKWSPDLKKFVWLIKLKF